MFGSLVANAFDFLRHSIEELETKPKYSVINFYAAIELFLKARLMIEHWSLIIEEASKANFDKFIAGEFISVGMDSAINRLQNIVGVPIHKDAAQTFTTLRKHRNKLIHFFHDSYEKADSKTIQEVVIEQSRGWFYLHRLLTKDWNDIFIDYQDEINGLHESVRRKQGYLKFKYESLKSSIEAGKARGVVFASCESCKFEARSSKVIFSSLVVARCLVCELRNALLIEKCPNCSSNIELYDLGEGTCTNCRTAIDLNYLLNKYAPPEYGNTEPPYDNRAYCGDCEYTTEQSVVPFDDKWLCLICLNLHNGIEQCEYCGENVAGDMDDSFAFGCPMCEGQAGHLED
jgi:hypothetical protein